VHRQVDKDYQAAAWLVRVVEQRLHNHNIKVRWGQIHISKQRVRSDRH
jgi:hypothetical protein